MNVKNTIICLLVIGFLYSCSTDYFGSSDQYTALAGDKYNVIEENPFIPVSQQPISTFSVDADGASYANVRRYILQEDQLPPKDAVRTEELINYFNLDYQYTDSSHPIALNGELSQCPWNTEHKIMRIGIKGKSIAPEDLPSSSFVFLIDVSASMLNKNKLDLLKEGFKLFVDELKDTDRVSIVTYAGSAGVVLESTSVENKNLIIDAIDNLGTGASTAGAEGIITAYEIAKENFIDGGNNRIIIGTDGDFNVGLSSQEELVKLIEEKREYGIFLTILGVGRRRFNDANLEQIANKGNGTYEYIDNLKQLKKVFIYDFNKFFTVAKDVKVQVEFNSENVEAYRLIGYANRLLQQEDFEDDDKDAGEIGSNQNITALYELKPKENPDYQSVPTSSIDFRYKNPNSETSISMDLKIFDEGKSFTQSSDFMKFTTSVASFGMLLKESKYKGDVSYDKVINWLKTINLKDEHQFKSELKSIVEKAKKL